MDLKNVLIDELFLSSCLQGRKVYYKRNVSLSHSEFEIRYHTWRNTAIDVIKVHTTSLLIISEILLTTILERSSILYWRLDYVVHPQHS